MSVPIVIPELGVGDERVRVSIWLVEPGDDVNAGDRVVELLMPGVTFDVSAPESGVLSRIEKPTGAEVKSGEVLGWLDISATSADEQTT